MYFPCTPVRQFLSFYHSSSCVRYRLALGWLQLIHAADAVDFLSSTVYLHALTVEIFPCWLANSENPESMWPSMLRQRSLPFPLKLWILPAAERKLDSLLVPVLSRCVLCWQVISLEGWVDIMYNVQDAQSFWSWIYFATLIVVSGVCVCVCVCEPVRRFCCVFSWRDVTWPLWCRLYFFCCADYQLGRLGKYYVLCTRRSFVLGLDLFCDVNCGKLSRRWPCTTR